MNEYQIIEAVKTEAVVRLAETYPIDSNHRAPIVESGWTVLAILEKAASEPCHRAEYGWQGDCANIQDSGPDMHYACGRCIARAFLKELAGQAEEQEQAVANKQPGVGYPVDWRTHLLGPTLFYIDEAGTPIELRLTNDQVKMIVDDFNTREVLEHAEEIVNDDSFVETELKPPIAA